MGSYRGCQLTKRVDHEYTPCEASKRRLASPTRTLAHLAVAETEAFCVHTRRFHPWLHPDVPYSPYSLRNNTETFLNVDPFKKYTTRTTSNIYCNLLWTTRGTSSPPSEWNLLINHLGVLACASKVSRLHAPTSPIQTQLSRSHPPPGRPQR